jgi:hypothetical protein
MSLKISEHFTFKAVTVFMFDLYIINRQVGLQTPIFPIPYLPGLISMNLTVPL